MLWNSLADVQHETTFSMQECVCITQLRQKTTDTLRICDQAFVRLNVNANESATGTVIGMKL